MQEGESKMNSSEAIDAIVGEQIPQGQNMSECEKLWT